MPGTTIAVLEPVIGTERYARLVTAAGRFRDRLGPRTIWNINSTAVGGGVAELLAGKDDIRKFHRMRSM